MSITIDITDFEVFSALRNYLNLLFPNIEVIRTQVDNVPMPKGPFITMNDVARKRLATNFTEWDKDKGIKISKMSTEHVIQVDFYGEGSAQRVQQFSTLFYDEHGYENMPANIKPMYNTMASQYALISAEENFVERWKTDVHLNVNITVTSPQIFIDELHVNIKPPMDLINPLD